MGEGEEGRQREGEREGEWQSDSEFGFLLRCTFVFESRFEASFGLAPRPKAERVTPSSSHCYTSLFPPFLLFSHCPLLLFQFRFARKAVGTGSRVGRPGGFACCQNFTVHTCVCVHSVCVCVCVVCVYACDLRVVCVFAFYDC